MKLPTITDSTFQVGFSSKKFSQIVPDTLKRLFRERNKGNFKVVIGNEIQEFGSIVKATFLSNSVENLSTLDIAVCVDQMLFF